MASLFAVGNVIRNKTTSACYVVVQTPIRMRMMETRTAVYALREDTKHDRPVWLVVEARVLERDYALVRAERRE